MPPAGKVSGFHREGDDWYSLSKSYMENSIVEDDLDSRSLIGG